MRRMRARTGRTPADAHRLKTKRGPSISGRPFGKNKWRKEKKMAKLYFRYGTMGSSKTANAMMVRYNYVDRGQAPVMLKPRIEHPGPVLRPADRLYRAFV